MLLQKYINLNMKALNRKIIQKKTVFGLGTLDLG
jgi:hypothetical protein